MFRSLLITSPGPQEGKTLTACNLGVVFAMLPSFKVLIVDGDLRKGTLRQWLGLRHHTGLTNLIDGSATLDDVILKCNDLPVHFVVRGTSKLSAAELLHSPRLKANFQKMAERFDLVLVDSPPVNLIADAQLLAAACDAVLLVARAFSTSQKNLEEAAAKLAPFRLVGTVLNGKPTSFSGYRYRYEGTQED
jgi:capsular exopolysaccharide synthesis family protein